MPWVESASESFRARHDSADAESAADMLGALEELRDELAEWFPRPVDGLTVVVHRSQSSLWLAQPALPLTWAITAPSARRYLGGAVSSDELHVLAPDVLAARASNVPGSREMLARTPQALYARRLITENNRDLMRTRRPRRRVTELRWAWLLEGTARWLAGQTDHARPAIARRLREGPRPSFPPGVRDAPLLGGTVIDLLAHEEGEPAAVRFASRLHPDGARAALTDAFGGRSLLHTEGAWRSHLSRLAGAG